jgi:hypothetical protein
MADLNIYSDTQAIRRAADESRSEFGKLQPGMPEYISNC